MSEKGDHEIAGKCTHEIYRGTLKDHEALREESDPPVEAVEVRGAMGLCTTGGGPGGRMTNSAKDGSHDNPTVMVKEKPNVKHGYEFKAHEAATLDGLCWPEQPF